MYPLTAALIISSSDIWDEVQPVLRATAVRVVLELPGVGAAQNLHERLVQSRPDVVLLDIHDLTREEGAEFIRQIRRLQGTPDVIAIHRTSDAETILAAMRAGAAEFLYPPLGDTLKEALERIAAEREKKGDFVPRGGKTVGVLSAKGGCGATTIACHLALALHRETRKPVLLADLDLAAGIIRKLMQPRSRYSILDATANIQRLDAAYWKALVSNGAHGLEVIAGPVDPLVADRPGTHQVRHVLRFVRTQYDWTVVDLGRGLSPEVLGAIDELDEILLVTTPEVPALHQAKRMLESLAASGHGGNRVRLVLNRMVRRPDVTPEELEGILGVAIYAVIPNDYQSLKEVYSEGRLLPENTGLYKRIAGLARKVSGAGEETRKRPWFSLFGS